MNGTMNGGRLKKWCIPLVLAAFGATAGCASNDNRRLPSDDQFVRATASVAAADNTGAYEHGSLEMNLARQKLAAAAKAREEGDDELAQRLAVEADLDATLAAAKARSHEMQSAVAELRESIRTLKQELLRSQQQTLGRL